MRAAGVVVTKQIGPSLERHRVDVKSEVSLDHVPVVDVIDLAQVLLRRGPHSDFAVAQLEARRLRFTPPSLFTPLRASGRGAPGARMGGWTGSRSRACRSAAGMELCPPSARTPDESRSTSMRTSTSQRPGGPTTSRTP